MSRFTSYTTGPAVELLEQLVDLDRRAELELYRVECVETGASERMVNLLRTHPRMAVSKCMDHFIALIRDDLADDRPAGRLLMAGRTDLVFSYALAMASINTIAVRALFVTVCDLLVRRKELRAAGSTERYPASLLLRGDYERICGYVDQPPTARRLS